MATLSKIEVNDLVNGNFYANGDYESTCLHSHISGDVNVVIRTHEADEDGPAFQTISIEGYRMKKGKRERVELVLFTDASATLTIDE